MEPMGMECLRIPYGVWNSQKGILMGFWDSGSRVYGSGNPHRMPENLLSQPDGTPVGFE